MPTEFKPARPTYDQQQALDVGMVAFMEAAPFYAYLFHSIGEMVITKDVASLATDGRRIAINPERFMKLKPMERVFGLAHEMSHIVCKHPRRYASYKKAGGIKGLPVDQQFANMCMDLIINADLVQSGVGRCNPDWLYDPAIDPNMLWEDLYEKFYPKQPKPQDQQGQPDKPCNDGPEGGDGEPQEGQGEGKRQPQPKVRPDQKPKVHRDAPGGLKGQAGDPQAAANDGMFDEIFEPGIDPGTGEPEEIDENEFREAVARAASAAKAVGKFSDNLKRLVDGILEPTVDWRDHIRLLVTGSVGSARETWARPNRRRLALNPIVIMPGRKGHGCELVAIGVDTSGSIGQDELRDFFAEISGIVQDIKPRKIVVIGCDYDVTQVDHLENASDFDTLRVKGVKGGGGTRFQPVFDYLTKENLVPDTLVYLTDGFGPAAAKPGYPVIWCLSKHGKAQPWGEHVHMS